VSLLEVSGLNGYYGDSHILFEVSLRVERNDVVALLVATARARARR
jgi:branched-chain amino acid transport system ATP-binding protein